MTKLFLLLTDVAASESTSILIPILLSVLIALVAYIWMDFKAAFKEYKDGTNGTLSRHEKVLGKHEERLDDQEDDMKEMSNHLGNTTRDLTIVKRKLNII